MLKELQQHLLQLENYYSGAKQSKKSIKQKKTVDERLKIIQKAIEISIVPQLSLKRGLFFLSEDALICVQHSEHDHDKMLGEIPASFMSYSHKMGQVSYDFVGKYVSVQMELIQNQKIPIEYVKVHYGNFHADNEPINKALSIVNVFQQKKWQIEKNENPQIRDKKWIDSFIGGDNIPAQLQRITFIDDKPQFEFFFNTNYMMLIGVLPNILIDAIVQTQLIPEIDERSDLTRWIDLAQGVIDANDNPIQKQNNTLIVTYEGMRLGCLITQTNFHTYSEQTKIHSYVRKLTYQLTNPNASQYVFDMKRIHQNSFEYLRDNQTTQKNTKMDHQLQFGTNSEMQAKYKLMEPCGFKVKSV